MLRIRLLSFTRFPLASLSIALILGLGSCRPIHQPEYYSPPPGLTDFPGANRDSTRNFLARLDFTPGHRDSIFDGWVRCHDTSECGGADSVHLRIVPERRAHHVSVHGALRAGPGYIVAVITNLSASPYGSYRLAANDTAYLWAGLTPRGQRRIGFFRISRVTGEATGLSVATTAGFCAAERGAKVRRYSAVHLYEMPKCAHTPFYRSERSAREGNVRLASLVSRVSLVPPDGLAPGGFAHSRGVWISCWVGCCEGANFEQM